MPRGYSVPASIESPPHSGRLDISLSYPASPLPTSLLSLNTPFIPFTITTITTTTTTTSTATMLFVAVSATLALATLAAAQSVSDIPQCALGCFATSVTDSGCTFTDYECQCSTGQAKLAASLVPCLCQSTCTADDFESESAPPPPRLTLVR